ncbi:hypothetical protein [Tamlana sp. I1]|uniref:hypothetical protein n=1 Tax=Tamlana sp. I1 TaxID=2762061 RepID=UPI0018907ADD|nr:hypothetical protein [Tamlana sp. I1]
MFTDLNDIRKSEITAFKAEVFYEELKFVLGNTNGKDFWIKNHGMNSRAFSKDVLDITSYTPQSMQLQQDNIFIHLSRNSIYHQLPEIIFHPLVISNASMSNREVVEAMRENRKKEEENLHFFTPFDTALFDEKLKLTNRYINIFTDDYAKQNLFAFATAIIKKDIPLSKEQLYKLFLNLCNSEQLKENLPELETLFRSILGFDVLLEYKPCVLEESPFEVLGQGVLGYNLGTQGPVTSEQDDIYATLLLEESLDYKTLEKHREIIEKILAFFISANRAVKVAYQFPKTNGFELGTTSLGYNTRLLSTQNTNKTNTLKTSA